MSASQQPDVLPAAGEHQSMLATDRPTLLPPRHGWTRQPGWFTPLQILTNLS
jgi:hypothetical protein